MVNNKDYIISKKDKHKFYEIIHDKNLPPRMGGIIGEYDDDRIVVTLDNDQAPFLDEYGIKYEKRSDEDYLDYIKMKGRYKPKWL